MAWYLAVSAVSFLLLGSVWSMDNVLNFFVKVALIVFGLWALFLDFNLAGYIIRR